MGYGEEFYARLKELSLLALKQSPSPELLKQWRWELCELQGRERRDERAAAADKRKIAGRHFQP